MKRVMYCFIISLSIFFSGCANFYGGGYFRHGENLNTKQKRRIGGIEFCYFTDNDLAISLNLGIGLRFIGQEFAESKKTGSSTGYGISLDKYFLNPISYGFYGLGLERSNVAGLGNENINISEINLRFGIADFERVSRFLIKAGYEMGGAKGIKLEFGASFLVNR